jgi:hypothetical protein
MTKEEQNNYKEIFTRRNMNKKGQVGIYIIIAVVIVIAGVLIYFFYPQISSFVGGEIIPNNYLKGCVEDSVRENVELLASQGGYSNPEGFILYQNQQVKYLCYNAQYYLPCQVQQPMIKKHFEEELNKAVTQKANECVASMIQAYEKRGYEVSAVSDIKSIAEIVPDKIVIKVDAPMTVSKETTRTYTDFNIEMKSKMYELLMIATSVIDYESTYGDAEISLYLQYYPNLRMQKIKLGDGSTVYTLEDVTTEEEFVFASRSVAWPPGFGYEAI